MVDRDLQTLLRSILHELDEVDGENEADDARLRRIKEDMHRLAEADAEVSPELPEGGLERLSDAVTEWETRHPRLTQALQQVVDLLSDMGI